MYYGRVPFFCVSPSGDLTENQKKIFKANQFYRGLAIPEPQETVGGVLKLERSHTSQGLYSLSTPIKKKKCRHFLGKLRLLSFDQFLNDLVYVDSRRSTLLYVFEETACFIFPELFFVLF